MAREALTLREALVAREALTHREALALREALVAPEDTPVPGRETPTADGTDPTAGRDETTMGAPHHAPTSVGAIPATTDVGQERTAEIAAQRDLALPPEARRGQAAETTPVLRGQRPPPARPETGATTPTGGARERHETTADSRVRTTRDDLAANAKITGPTHRGATRIVIHGATIDTRPDRLTGGLRSTLVADGIRPETTDGPTGVGKTAETSTNSGAGTGDLRPEMTDARPAPGAGFDASTRRPTPARAGHQSGGFQNPSKSNALTFLPVLAAPGWADPIRNS